MVLSLDELARWTGTTPEAITELVDHGLIAPVEDGAFTPQSVHVARLMLALIESGIPVTALGEAASERSISLDLYSQWFPSIPNGVGIPMSEVAAAAGVDHDDITWIHRHLGLATPDPTSRVDEDEAAVLIELLGLADQLGDRDALRRALTAFGSSAARAMELALALYAEHYRDVADETPDDAVMGGVDPRIEPWTRLARMSPNLLAWAYRRHLERGVDSFSVENTERYLAHHGYVPEPGSAEEAIAFVDIAGYSAISERDGDATGALIASRLGDIAADVAMQTGGRLVKQLGDGVMLHFQDAGSAMEAVVDLMDRADERGLPALHSGVSCGPMVNRDGDFYGHTVNLAARLSDAAPPGRVYATHIVADAAERDFIELGPMQLDGMENPVVVHVLGERG